MTTSGVASDSVSTTDKYAWSENVGWVNHKPTNAGVTVYTDHLEGYAWSENVGWIKVGSYSGSGAYNYVNSSTDDWGVNRSGSALSGFAWSELAGWINFSPANGGVTLDPANGLFDGWAWGENLGWVHFKNDAVPYGVSLQKHLLSLFFSGAGSGLVSSNPAGINCSSDCSYSYFPGTVLTLTASTSTPQSTFDSWWGECEGVGPCPVVMTADRSMTAEFGLGPNNQGPMAKILETGYRSIHDAYSAAGADETILAIAGLHSSMSLDKIKIVTLKGGYAIDGGYNFTGQSGYTTISGPLAIRGGTLNAERIKIITP